MGGTRSDNCAQVLVEPVFKEDTCAGVRNASLHRDRLGLDPVPCLGRHLIGKIERDPAADGMFEVTAKSENAPGDALDQKVQPSEVRGWRPPAYAVDLVLIGHLPNDLAACEYQLFHATPTSGRC